MRKVEMVIIRGILGIEFQDTGLGPKWREPMIL
jgi:hypothetical protein